MARLGFGGKAPQMAPEWTRPALHNGLSYSSEDAAVATAKLEEQPNEKPQTISEMLQEFGSWEHLHESASVPLKALEDEQPPTVIWTIPSRVQRPGLYWHTETPGDIEALEQRVVLQVGNQYCVRIRRPDSDSVIFRNVKLTRGLWAGPIAIPEGVELEDLG